MIIRGVSKQDLELALSVVNSHFYGNITMSKCEPLTKNGLSWRVRLGVVSSHGSGARRSWSGRRVAAACWHAHGHFFRALPDSARITTGFFMVNGRNETFGPNDEWVDGNVGSLFNPVLASELCEC